MNETNDSKNTPWLICGIGTTTTALLGIPQGIVIDCKGADPRTLPQAPEPGQPITLSPVFELHTVRVNVPQQSGEIGLINELKIIPFLDLPEPFPVRCCPTWIVRLSDMPPSRRERLITSLEAFAKHARAKGAGLVLP